MVKKHEGDLWEENLQLKKQLQELANKNRELSKQLATMRMLMEKKGSRSTPAASSVEKGRKPMRFNIATVLYVNAYGFNDITHHQNADGLVDELDRVFYHFELIANRYNLVKIKTIGDSFMFVGGIPERNRTNPIEIVKASLEMLDFIDKLQDDYATVGKPFWEIRMGIHTGTLTADALSKKNYEVKGEAVNIAARMAASGENGLINISGDTYEFVKDFFRCLYRGKMPIKYKGQIDMYQVKGYRPEYSVGGEGVKANDKFNVQLALIRYDDLDELVLDRLERDLPKNLYYHTLKHTIDVCIEVEIIGRGEGIDDEELLLLKTAALFHDSGFMLGYNKHEELGVVLAKDYLSKFLYTDKQIEQICELIMATKLPPTPKNKLEEIICDADLDYLGRRDFIPVSNMLFKELYEHQRVSSLDEWNELQIKFLENHQYFTDTAKKMRDVNKLMQLENIRNQMKDNKTL